MFITFEGIEGCGKSTQAERLASRLVDLAVPVVRTLEPGGTQVGHLIRKILLDSRNEHLSPLAELLLYAADRAQHVKEVIKPSLDQGKWVVCDRFFDATTVYQGHARGQDQTLIGVLHEKTTQGVVPDVTFLLDCPVEVGLRRAKARIEMLNQTGQDRFEREEAEFHQMVRQGYLREAEKYPHRFVVLDGSLPQDSTHEQVFNHMKQFLPEGTV